MQGSKITNIKSEKLHVRVAEPQIVSFRGFPPVDYKANSAQNEEETTIVGIQKYRDLLSDTTSTDEQIIKRLQYIEALCRNVIRREIKNHVESKKK